MSSEPPRIKTTALTHNEEYCTVAIHNLSQVLQANVSHDPDSENVNRLWSDRPQPSGDANIIRCSWSFTLLMNLHDFVIESFNCEHIFRDARTIPFLLTSDHISTCLMMSARFKSAGPSSARP